MPIETTCPGCSRRLRVADEHAGKTARCPACQTLYQVPAVARGSFSERPQQPAAGPLPSGFSPVFPSPNPSSPNPSPFVSAPTGSPTASRPFGGVSSTSTAPVQWRLRTEDGSIYGPVERQELDNWVAQGRVTPNAEVQQDGDGFWQRAASVYPELAITQPAGNGGNPFAEQPTMAANPYVTPRTVGGRLYAQSHRGGLVLALGLLGVFGCSLLGPVALVMGLIDLQKMSNGTMDPSGKGLTIAGMVIGGITVCIMAAAVLMALAAEL